MAVDTKSPEFKELVNAVATSDDYKAKAQTMMDELHKEVDGKSWDIMAPKFEKLIESYDQKRLISDIYSGGKRGLSETMKGAIEFGNTKSLPDDLIKHYVPQIQNTDVTRALAGYIKYLYMQKEHLPIPAEVKKAMGETTGSQGGFLIPIEFRAELLRLVIEDQVIRPNAFVMPMAGDTLWVPRIVDTSHQTTIHGGVTGTWVGESADLSSGESDPTFGLVQLIAKKFSDFKTIPNELVMDSPIAIVPLLGVLLREGLGFFEDVSAIWGGGGSAGNQMLGIMKSPALITVTRAVAAHISWPDVLKMRSKMFPSSYKRCFYACSPSAYVDIGQMSVSVGVGGNAVMVGNMPGQTAANPWPNYLDGRPLVISEKFQTLGTAGDLVLIDPSYYIIGDRMEPTLAASTERYFEKDQLALRIIERLDGQPWISGTLTAYNGTDTLSAFVALN